MDREIAAKLPGIAPTGINGIGPLRVPMLFDLRDEVAELRRVAERLASRHGKNMAAYLQKRADEAAPEPPDATQSPQAVLLAMLTLDRLGLHRETAATAVRLYFKSEYRSVGELLYSSFCSPDVPEIAANLLVKRLLRGNPRAIPDAAVLDFIAAAGNETTLGLLKKATRRSEYYENAAAEIGLRLALPEKPRAARARDAMLFWQAVHCAPDRGVTGFDYATEAAILSKHKLSISPEYLIEQLEHPRMAEWAGHFYADQGRTNMAIEIVAHQKENSAVPALAKLVRSSPEFRERVEHVLKTIGTPEATRALEDVSARKEKG